MVNRKNLKKYALLSVYNKADLKYLCENLLKFNYSFIATGSTHEYIKKIGYESKNITKVTGFKEILEGRVKTLNPKIFGSILYDRDKDKHTKDFKDLGVPKIDIVVVNLYPFQKFLKLKETDNLIEMIDIGGSSLIRAASKNFKYVTVLSKTKDYKYLISNIKKNSGDGTDLDFRKKMATQAFMITSEYDKNIFDWFNGKKHNLLKLRYGENPGQAASLSYKNGKKITDFQLNGKELSYNNIVDVDSGYKCLNEFKDTTCIILKHGNPCGVASSNNILSAFIKAYSSDPVSAFGGIVFFNRKINTQLSNKIVKLFFEIIVAPDFDKASLNILKRKKNIILLKIKNLNLKNKNMRSTIFGDLYQDEDLSNINTKFINHVSKRTATKKEVDDLIFSLKIVKHTKSNSVVISNNRQTVGIGSGQTNRVNALKLAILNMKKNFKNIKFVCASDGFFPFTDSIKLLKKNNCNVIAQPHGSINDQKIINYSIKNKISLYFTQKRMFRH